MLVGRRYRLPTVLFRFFAPLLHRRSNLHRQMHAENAAFSRFALHRYITAVFVDDFGNDGQPRPTPCGLVVKNGLKMLSRWRDRCRSRGRSPKLPHWHRLRGFSP